jgi:hypothetical protein
MDRGLKIVASSYSSFITFKVVIMFYFELFQKTKWKIFKTNNSIY